MALSLVGSECWVAIVDDDEMIRRSLTRLFRASGISVRTFHSAQSYLSSASDVAPACLILDMHLRDAMTGLDLGELLRGQGAPPPIIFITAQADVEVGPAGAGIGSAVLLCKPFEPAVLLDLVAERLGLDRSSSAR